MVIVKKLSGRALFDVSTERSLQKFIDDTEASEGAEHYSSFISTPFGNGAELTLLFRKKDRD